MDAAMVASVGKIGSALVQGEAALGSCLGIVCAASAAIGAWKKCHAQNRPAPLLQFVLFSGAPLTQTFYGLIAAIWLNRLVVEEGALHPGILGWGLLAGLAIGTSAWMQGRIGAAAADAFAETGQGFTNHVIALGMVESVAIFIMVFTMLLA